MDAMKTGELIAQVRKEKGLTQRELAEKVYVSVQAVSKWELGKNFPDLSLMEPLADVLGLTVSELLAGRQGEEPQDALVRDTLRLGEEQLRPKIKKWRERFITAAVLLALLLMGLAGLWVDRNTVKPQRETILEAVKFSPEEQAMFDLLNKQGDGKYFLGMYNLTLADDMENYRLELELWTHEGMERSWTVGHGSVVRGSSPESSLFTFRIPVEKEGTAPVKVMFGTAGGERPADDLAQEIPYLDGEMYLAYASRAVVDREHGAILMEAALNPNPGANPVSLSIQLLGRTDDPQPGTLEEGTASLILKLYWD